MEYTKEFYQCVIRVIDYIKQGHRSVYCDKGDELAGNYWPDVVKLFREKKAVTVDEGGDIFLTKAIILIPFISQAKMISRKSKRQPDIKLSMSWGS